MAGISEELRLDIAGFVANLNSAVSQARASLSSLDQASSGGSKMFVGAPQAARAMATATNQATASIRANSAAMSANSAKARSVAGTIIKVGIAAGTAGHALDGISKGVSAISAAAKSLPVVARRFKQLRASAGAMSQSLTKAAGNSRALMFTVKRVVPVLVVATAGVWALRKAWQALAGTKSPKLKVPKAPKQGSAGSGASSAFKGAGMVALGGLAAAGIVKGISAAAGKIKSVIGGVIRDAANEESLQIRMDVLVGDPARAKELMAELKNKAANTPLEFGDLAGAATKLLAFGEASDKVTETLGRVGDISSGVGAGIGEIAEIYGKARVQGTLFAEDINQLTGRGIPVIQEFAKQLGVSEGEVKKMGSQGKITFANLEKAFTDLTSKGGRFGGMMAKQSQTVTGKFSTLRDVIAENRREMGKPIIDAIKPILDAMISNIKAIKARAAEIGAKIATGIKTIIAAIRLLAQMDFSQIAALIGAGLMLAIKSSINVLFKGLMATFAAAGAYFVEMIRNAMFLLRVVTTGDFWRGMGNALLGVAQLFTAAIMSGIAKAITAIKAQTGIVGRTILGDSDKNLQAGADILGQAGAANMSEAGAQLDPIMKEGAKRFQDAAINVGTAFAKGYANTKNLLNTDSEQGRLADFANAIKAGIPQSKKIEDAGKTTGAGSGAIASKGAGFATNSRLAGAINLLSGRSANAVIAAQGAKTAANTERTAIAVEKMAKQGSSGNKPAPKPVPVTGARF